MAIQNDTTDVGGLREGPSWAEVLTVSDIAAGIFDVRWDLRPRLRRWLAAHDLPTAGCREPHLPATDAWAVLDGGVLCSASITVSGPEPGPGSHRLAPGMRVIGFQAFRLLVDELGLPGPATVLAGEPVSDPTVLRARFAARVPDAAAREQAELLATCTDRTALRWVSAALRTGPPPRS